MIFNVGFTKRSFATFTIHCPALKFMKMFICSVKILPCICIWLLYTLFWRVILKMSLSKETKAKLEFFLMLLFFFKFYTVRLLWKLVKELNYLLILNMPYLSILLFWCLCEKLKRCDFTFWTPLKWRIFLQRF